MSGRDIAIFGVVILLAVGISLPALSYLKPATPPQTIAKNKISAANQEDETNPSEAETSGDPVSTLENETETDSSEGSTIETNENTSSTFTSDPNDEGESSSQGETSTEATTEPEEDSDPKEPALAKVESGLPIALPGETPDSIRGGYKLSDDKFEVRVPKKYSTYRKQTSSTWGNGQRWNGSYGNLKWGVTIWEIGGSATRGIISDKQRSEKGARERDAIILHDTPLEMNKCWGKFFSVEEQDHSNRRDTMWYGGHKRMYHIFVYGPPKEVESAAGRMIFLSFNIKKR